MSNKAIKFSICFISMFIIMLGFTNCSPVHETEGEGGTTSPSLGPESPAILGTTLLPTLQTNCNSCHDVGNPFLVPEFAVTDAESAHEVLLSFGLINTDTPLSSSIISKISAGHSGIDVSVADDISDDIAEWFDQLSTTE